MANLAPVARSCGAIHGSLRMNSCILFLLWFLTQSNAFVLESSWKSSAGTGHPPSSACVLPLCAKSQAAKERLTSRWYPGVDDDEKLEDACLLLARDCILKRIDDTVPISELDQSLTTQEGAELAKDRFHDLCTSTEGSMVLESLFSSIDQDVPKDHIIGAIYCLQSLCIMGMMAGMKGSPEALQRRVKHLMRTEYRSTTLSLDHPWDMSNIQRLKYELNQAPGTQLLAELELKRTSQGAFDFLVALGAWDKHENLCLLRSGFPIAFQKENSIMKEPPCDVDQEIGIRRDLSHLKVYTIDAATTSEVDDGLSVERLDDGRYKYWIHIADAGRWAPRDSDAYEIAKQRATSHYLPTGTIPMFPTGMATEYMSLRPNQECCALSLSVELNDDGSIDPSSLDVFVSTVKVSYRLSYDEVNDMLQEGVAFREEWELGALLEGAKKRRNYRNKNGSSDVMIPYPIPQSILSTFEDSTQPDGIGIRIEIEGSPEDSVVNQVSDETINDESPILSDSNLLVTELMILAGEAMGKWKLKVDQEPPTFCGRLENDLKLPYRSQSKPDYHSRQREYKIFQDLLEYKKGNGYCHAWFARRFLSPARLSREPFRHHGLGVEQYVQWTSPIRRFGDLQVHTIVKRYLRRRHLHDAMYSGDFTGCDNLTSVDLGCPLPTDSSADEDVVVVDSDVDLFRGGQRLTPVARKVNRDSKQYWLFEHLSRLQKEGSPIFSAIVLGCVDPKRKQYAVYLPQLGLEHRYLSQKGFLNAGDELKLKIQSVNPLLGLLTLELDVVNI